MDKFMGRVISIERIILWHGSDQCPLCKICPMQVVYRGHVSDDVTFYQGKFYAVQGTCHVFVVEDLASFSPFEVFKLDFDGSRWMKVFYLGKYHALFVGDNQSFSIRTSDVPGCKGNCIYFTDDYAEQNVCDYPVGGFDIGIFYMESGTTGKCYQPDARVIRPPPVWFTTHWC
ncbi:hypothetical protein ACHQM5_012730 [Ranunculus cassubicifolius]